MAVPSRQRGPVGSIRDLTRRKRGRAVSALAGSRPAAGCRCHFAPEILGVRHPCRRVRARGLQHGPSRWLQGGRLIPSPTAVFRFGLPRMNLGAPELNPGTSGQNFFSLGQISGVPEQDLWAPQQNSRSPGQNSDVSDSTPGRPAKTFGRPSKTRACPGEIPGLHEKTPGTWGNPAGTRVPLIPSQNQSGDG